MRSEEKISASKFMNGSVPLAPPRAFLGSTRVLTQLSLLVAGGLVLFLFESFLPHPVPWAKIGLANVTTLLALYLFDLKAALIVVAVRVIVGSLFLGTTLNPAFLFSLLGGIVSALAMGIAIKYTAHIFSEIGISVIGATTHNLIQLFLAYVLLVRKWEILYLVPVFIIIAVIAGTIIGVLVHFLLRRFAH